MKAITIGIPVYNRVDYLRSTIESIINQSYTDIELLVIDDCSDVDVMSVVQPYLHDVRVKYVRNESNIGLAANFSRVCELARSEYVMIVCEDDPLQSVDALKSMNEALETHPDVVLVAASRNEIDGDSRVLRVVKEYETGKYPGREIVKDCILSYRNKIGPPSCVLFRRLDTVGFFDHHYNQLVDLDMWFRTLKFGNFYYIAQPLCSLRVHDNRQTHLNKATNRHYFEFDNLIKSNKEVLTTIKDKITAWTIIYRGKNRVIKHLVKVGKLKELPEICSEFNIKAYDVLLYPIYKLVKLLIK